MRSMIFVGLGLNDEKGITLQGLEEIKSANTVFIELYTNLMPNFSLKNLEKLSGKKIHTVSRKDLEEGNGRKLMEAAKAGKTVLLVPGDPLIATTHVALRIQAEKMGIKTKVVHGASVLSAVIGLSGLQNYKFGRTVTIPFPETNPSEAPYEVIAENQERELHTLCLLDIDAEGKRYLNIAEALQSLLKVEQKRKKKIVTTNMLVVGIARAGSSEPTVRANFINHIVDEHFGDPPYSLIFPASLHFTEAEALLVLAHAPEEIKRMIK